MDRNMYNNFNNNSNSIFIPRGPFQNTRQFNPTQSFPKKKDNIFVQTNPSNMNTHQNDVYVPDNSWQPNSTTNQRYSGLLNDNYNKFPQKKNRRNQNIFTDDDNLSASNVATQYNPQRYSTNDRYSNQFVNYDHNYSNPIINRQMAPIKQNFHNPPNNMQVRAKTFNSIRQAKHNNMFMEQIQNSNDDYERDQYQDIPDIPFKNSNEIRTPLYKNIEYIPKSSKYYKDQKNQNYDGEHKTYQPEKKFQIKKVSRNELDFPEEELVNTNKNQEENFYQSEKPRKLQIKNTFIKDKERDVDNDRRYNLKDKNFPNEQIDDFDDEEYNNHQQKNKLYIKSSFKNYEGIKEGKDLVKRKLIKPINQDEEEMYENVKTYSKLKKKPIKNEGTIDQQSKNKMKYNQKLKEKLDSELPNNDEINEVSSIRKKENSPKRKPLDENIVNKVKELQKAEEEKLKHQKQEEAKILLEKHDDEEINYNKELKETLSSTKTEKCLLTSMCSLEEIKKREEQNNLFELEIDPSISYYDEEIKRNVVKAKPEFCIKAFQRSAADVKVDNPENIRTPETLTFTMNYIINEIIDLDLFDSGKYFKIKKNENYSFQDICSFVLDRLRSIRQDFIIINSKGNQHCIDCHERIARFLIMCLNECLDYESFTGHQSSFKLVYEQLNATLTLLREFYNYVNIYKEENGYVSANQAEFYAYSIILSFNDKCDLLSLLNKLPNYVINTPIVELSRKIAKAYFSKDYILFFKLLRNNEYYLSACMMSLYFEEMRKEALEIMTKSSQHGKYMISLERLTDLLCFQDTSECIGFLDWFGILITEDMFDDQSKEFSLEKKYEEKQSSLLKKKTNHRFIERLRMGKKRKDVVISCIKTDGLPIKEVRKEKIQKEIKPIQIYKQVAKIETINDLTSIVPNKENLIIKGPLISQSKKEEEPEKKLLFQSPIIDYQKIDKFNNKSNNSLSLEKKQSSIGFNINHKEILNIKAKEKDLNNEEKESEEKDKFERLTKNFYQRIFIYYTWHSLCTRSKYTKYKKIIEKAKMRKKMQIFYNLKKVVVNIKLNREYIVSIIRNKMNEIGYRRITFSKQTLIYNTDLSYNYEEIKNMLMDKYLNQYQNNESLKGKNDFVYLNLNIFTEEKSFKNSKLKELFCEIANDIYIQYQKGDFYLSIKDLNNHIQIEENSFLKFKLITNIIFIDLLEKCENNINFESDFNTILKNFNYGILFFDFENVEYIKTIKKFHKYINTGKKIIFLPCLKPLNLETILDNMADLEQYFKVNQKYKNYNINKFPEYEHDMIKFYNNFEIYQMFDESIKIDEYRLKDAINLSETFYDIYNEYLMIISKQFQNSNFLKRLGFNFANPYWIRFFEEFEKVNWLYFSFYSLLTEISSQKINLILLEIDNVSLEFLDKQYCKIIADFNQKHPLLLNLIDKLRSYDPVNSFFNIFFFENNNLKERISLTKPNISVIINDIIHKFLPDDSNIKTKLIQRGTFKRENIIFIFRDLFYLLLKQLNVYIPMNKEEFNKKSFTFNYDEVEKITEEKMRNLISKFLDNDLIDYLQYEEKEEENHPSESPANNYIISKDLDNRLNSNFPLTISLNPKAFVFKFCKIDGNPNENDNLLQKKREKSSEANSKSNPIIFPKKYSNEPKISEFCMNKKPLVFKQVQTEFKI